MGTPSVVFDAGIGEGMDGLQPVQDRIARITSTIAYDRAGYGGSEAGPLPQNGIREAEELRMLLVRADVPRPYVLVGHSLGAFDVLIFAARHPEDVAGLVLLDPPPLPFALGTAYPDLGAMARRMTDQWQALADSLARGRDPRAKPRSVFFRMIASEHREMRATAQAIDRISSFGNVPLVIVGSGKPNPAFGSDAAGFQHFWIEQSRALTRKSTKGTFVLADGSSHRLFRDAPDIVERCIRTVIGTVRAR